MPKIQKSNGERKELMSDEMIKKCKSDIAKFGFSGKEYTQFLLSVRAMKDEDTVLKYPNHEIENYHQMFLKKNEVGDDDMFVLQKFKIMTTDESGNKYETGYFAPRSFWDKIYQTKID